MTSCKLLLKRAEVEEEEEATVSCKWCLLMKRLALELHYCQFYHTLESIFSLKQDEKEKLKAVLGGKGCLALLQTALEYS